MSRRAAIRVECSVATWAGSLLQQRVVPQTDQQPNSPTQHMTWHRLTARTLLFAAAVLSSLGHAAEVPLTCDPPPIVRADQVLAPVGFLRETLGCTVTTSDNGTFGVRYWGHSFSFEVGKKAAVRTGERVLLPAPPERLGDQVYLPLEPITEAVGFRYRREADRHNVLLFSFPDAKVLSCRTNGDGERLRIVYDLSSAVPFGAELHNGKLILTVPAAPGEGLLPRYDTGDWACSAATLDLASPGQVRLGQQANGRARLEWFTLSAPARLVVDVNKRYSESTSRAVAPGIDWTTTELGTGAGPVAVNVARVDLKSPAYEVRPAMAGDTLLQRDRPSRIAQRVHALVAVNGGFFATEGAPLGLVVIDKDLVRTPMYSRTSLGLTADGEAHIGRLSTQGYLRLDNGSKLPVAKLNGTRNGEAGVYLYTRWWDRVFPVSAVDYCLVVSGGKVVRGAAGMPVEVPADGYLAVGSGYMATVLAGIPAGARLSVFFDTAATWASMRHALGGGPTLVRNGREYVSAEGERFRTDVTNGRAPRTALGITADQHLLLVTVDGRQAGYSVGLTLRELAALMVKLGAQAAMNLDGGGSTSFVIGGQCRNRPSDGAERRVSNILAVVPRRAA
ncbi:MAG: hypothetical protein COZ06_30790 [Armatimonadetes bacterium CG_4_10_14_3_um_filter_66_18]|nr:MAG: hypothetical protein COZ06_30790 [Armatimonadetes bacterium CG_4_10_14_3_um_filter_66_18]